MAEAAANPSSPKVNPARQRALEPYLETLRLTDLDAEFQRGFERSLVFRGATGDLVSDPWVRERILEWSGLDSQAHGGPTDVAQAVALAMKSVDDMNTLDAHAGLGGPAFYALQGELMLDSAIGMALLRELQRSLDRHVKEGNLQAAKDLSRFHHALRRVVKEVKQRIGESERKRADELTGTLTDVPQTAVVVERTERGDSTAPADAPATSTRRHRRRRVANALGALPARTDIMILLLVAAVVFWLGVIKVPESLRESLPVLTREAFVNDAAFITVDARPPSMFIDVEAVAWDAMTEDQRLRTVGQVAGILLDEGYSGALLRTPDGRPLARWLRGRGPELIAPEHVPAPPPEAEAAEEAEARAGDIDRDP